MRAYVQARPADGGAWGSNDQPGPNSSNLKKKNSLQLGNTSALFIP